jgi:transposase InsO family protein
MDATRVANAHPWTQKRYRLVKAQTKEGKAPHPLYNVRGETLYFGDRRVVQQTDVPSVLERAYSNDSIGMNGRDKLYHSIKQRFVGVTKRAVGAFVANLEDRQLTRPVPKRRVAKPILVRGPNVHWQLDLTSMKPSRGRRYVVAVVDVFSKRAWAYALRNKQPKTVLAAVRAVLLEHRPRTIQTDNGGEFMGAFRTFVTGPLGARHVTSLPHSPWSNGAVERFNRTLKSLLARYKLRHPRSTWLDGLDAVMHNYNTTLHAATGTTPEEGAAAKGDAVRDIASRLRSRAAKLLSSGPQLVRFREGDVVRVSLLTESAERALGQFRKRAGVNWSSELFRVARVHRGREGLRHDSYQLKRHPRGGAVEGRYYSHELQAVDPSKLQPSTRARPEPTRRARADALSVVRESVSNALRDKMEEKKAPKPRKAIDAAPRRSKRARAAPLSEVKRSVDAWRRAQKRKGKPRE